MPPEVGAPGLPCLQVVNDVFSNQLGCLTSHENTINHAQTVIQVIVKFLHKLFLQHQSWLRDVFSACFFKQKST